MTIIGSISSISSIKSSMKYNILSSNQISISSSNQIQCGSGCGPTGTIIPHLVGGVLITANAIISNAVGNVGLIVEGLIGSGCN